MSLINCEINLFQTWYEDYILVYGGINDQVPKTCNNRYNTLCSVVTLSTQENAKLLDQF